MLQIDEANRRTVAEARTTCTQASKCTESGATDVRPWDCASLTQVRAKGAKVPGQGVPGVVPRVFS